MKMTCSFLTPLSVLIFCVACVSSSYDDASDDTHRGQDDAVSGHDDQFGVDRELTSLQKEVQLGKRRYQQLLTQLREDQHDEEMMAFNQSIQSFCDQTHRLRVSLTQHLRSLNTFMTCLTSCMKAHSSFKEHSGMEASIRYFCNHSCMMALEHHSQSVHVTLSASSGLQGAYSSSSTPDPGTAPIVG